MCSLCLSHTGRNFKGDVKDKRPFAHLYSLITYMCVVNKPVYFGSMVAKTRKDSLVSLQLASSWWHAINPSKFKCFYSRICLQL